MLETEVVEREGRDQGKVQIGQARLELARWLGAVEAILNPVKCKQLFVARFEQLMPALIRKRRAFQAKYGLASLWTPKRRVTKRK